MKHRNEHVLLGFDFGTKRIGVAVGQRITQTAQPLTTLKANQGVPDWTQVDKLIKTWQPDALIVGVPLNMDGSEQPLTTSARQFIQQLQQHYSLPIYEMDERLSTKEARDRLFTEGGYKALLNGQIDSLAAQLILQNWLTQTTE